MNQSEINKERFMYGFITLAWFSMVFGLLLIAFSGCAPAPGHSVRIMPLGDSITYGVGSCTDNQGEACNGYRIQLAQELHNGGVNFEFVGSETNGDGPDNRHEGHPGYLINDNTGAGKDLMSNVDTWVPAANPDVILLLIGTNSLIRNPDAQAAINDMSALLDKIHSLAPKALILVSPVTDTTLVGAFHDSIAQYNYLLPTLLASKSFTQEIEATDLALPDYYDTVHPNASGYTLLSHSWADAIIPKSL